MAGNAALLEGSSAHSSADIREPQVHDGAMKSVAALAFASSLALVVGCIGRRAPSNLIVEVANERAATGEFDWQSEGIFGTGFFRAPEKEPFPGCAIYRRGFGPGYQTIRVS